MINLLVKPYNLQNVTKVLTFWFALVLIDMFVLTGADEDTWNSLAGVQSF